MSAWLFNVCTVIQSDYTCQNYHQQLGFIRLKHPIYFVGCLSTHYFWQLYLQIIYEQKNSTVKLYEVLNKKIYIRLFSHVD